MPTIPPRIGLYQPYPHTFGGVQSMVLKLARSLPEQGYHPVVISPEQGAFTRMLDQEKLDYIVSDPGPCWHVYGRGDRSLSYLASPTRVLQLARYWFRLRADLKRHNIHLLHCNDYRAVMLAAPAGRLLRIPVIWHMHGFIPSRLANLVAAGLVRSIVPVSRGMLDYVPLPRWTLGRFEVINNGIDFPVSNAECRMPNAEFSTPPHHHANGVTPINPGHPPEPEGRRRMPWDAPSLPDAPAPAVVLAVGALHPRKGYETLIHAFKQVVASVPEAQCWIVGGEFGDGAYAESLRSLARRLHLDQHVRFVGHSDDVPRLLHQCRLLAIPSRIEAFGMVAIEAMLAGKPVVACRTGGLPEIIEDRHTGCLVAPEDAESMARSILEILSDQSLARKMGQAGQQRVFDNFTLKQMTEAFARFYGTLLQTT